MKVLLYLCLAVCAAIAVSSEDVSHKYPRFIEFTDNDGDMQVVDLEEKPDMELVNEVARNPANNRYILYTRRNMLISQTLELNNANSITRSNFNANVPTIVIVHGWLSSQYIEPNPTLRAAFLRKSDVNVIIMDWRRLAASTYPTAVAGVPAVGRGLGQFLIYLNSVTGAPFNRMHLIGFSLGAHIVGNAGRELGGRAARVTGLDPAGPMWNFNTNRLRSTDGVYVEAIHTDGGYGGLGIGSAVADADFFPNGGNSQPGCITSLCQHNRAWELFGSSIANNHLVGTGCSSMLQVTMNTCRGSTLPLGNDDLNKRGSGLFRLTTGRSYPY